MPPGDISLQNNPVPEFRVSQAGLQLVDLPSGFSDNDEIAIVCLRWQTPKCGYNTGDILPGFHGADKQKIIWRQGPYKIRIILALRPLRHARINGMDAFWIDFPVKTRYIQSARL